MEVSEANSILTRYRHLSENLEELDKKFGQLSANAEVAGHVQRADLGTVQDIINGTTYAMT